MDAPTAVRIGTSSWTAVSAGASSTCAIRDTGSLWCWGSGADGRLGQGNTTTFSSPQQVGSATNWTQVSVGNDHACAITSAATVWCWGRNDHGQLGTTSNASSPVPAQEAGAQADWTSVSSGDSHTCGIRTGGTLWCWGNGVSGRLGKGGTTDSANPVASSAGNTYTYTSVSAGLLHTCAVRSGGTLWCWGGGGEGQLGDGAHTQRVSPVQAGAASDWGSVSASVGGYSTCGVSTTGVLRCWGRNSDLQIGDSTDTAQRNTPTTVGAVTTWSVAGVGSVTACATRVDGSLWCWGSNTTGQMGVPLTNSTVPAAASGVTWRSIAVGRSFACGVRDTGTLWCWGANAAGQLGVGDSVQRNTPTQVVALATWVSVAAGEQHACALRSDATLWCWGNNASGRLGDNTTTQRNVPVQVTSPSVGWSSLSLGQESSSAITVGRALWCWGENGNGQLGLGTTGTTAASRVPQQVGTDVDWESISVGLVHACAIKTTGTLWCWGNDGNGRLGDGLSTTRGTPAQESTAAASWKAVDAGDGHTCAVRADGTLWCWGTNSSGQLGLGNTTTNTTTRSPQQVGSAADWQRLALGSDHACAIASGGVLRCWGANAYGRLGDGTTVNRLVPTTIAAGTTWSMLDAKFANTALLGNQ